MAGDILVALAKSGRRPLQAGRDFLGISMSITLRMAVITGVALLSARAFAAEPLNRPASNRHQLLACMTKRMSASRTVSYNEAARLCKDQLKAQNTPPASSAAVKPSTGLGH
jgi:hypothetical protein